MEPSIFDNSRLSTMSLKGLTCEVNNPEKLPERSSGNPHRLPPYAQRAAFLADECPAAPAEWRCSNDREMHYIVALREEHGIWINLTGNSSDNHHIAALIAVQGVNALTILPADKRLEQYREKCPKHNKTFGLERYCEDCGFKWAPQNYISTTSRQPMWLDGFFTQEGITRQMYYTKDIKREVGAAVLGNRRTEDIAITLFRSKEAKPKPAYRSRGLLGGDDLECLSLSPTRSMGGIGAGAEIRQAIGPDSSDPNFWRQEPEGTIYIHYVDEMTMHRILAGGRRKQEARFAEGPLQAAGAPFGAG